MPPRRPIRLLALMLVLMAVIATPTFARSPTDEAQLWLPMVLQQRKTDLGTIGGNYGIANAINNHNQVVGVTGNPSAETYTFVWSPGAGMQQIAGRSGHALNNHGHVAGETESEAGVRAIFWTPEQGAQNLGTLTGNGFSFSNGINDLDQVVGVTGNAGDPERVEAFIWHPGTGMRSLGTLGGYFSVANAINNRGQVVGYDFLDGLPRAFIWTEATGMQDLDTPLEGESLANDINDRGQVVGTRISADGDYHAFLWTAETGMVDLATLGCNLTVANAINNHGQIAGAALNTRGRYTAAYCQPDGTLVSLESATEELSYANDINDHGNVVGYSQEQGVYHAILWGSY